MTPTQIRRLANRVKRRTKDLARQVKKLARETDEMADALHVAADYRAAQQKLYAQTKFVNWSFDHDIDIPF